MSKQCLECYTVNDREAATCSACGGGSWPATTLPAPPPTSPQELTPVTEVAPDSEQPATQSAPPSPLVTVSESDPDPDAPPANHDGDEPSATQLPATQPEPKPKTGPARGKKTAG